MASILPKITPALTLRPLSPHIAALIEAATRRIAKAEQQVSAATLAAQAGLLPAPPVGRAILPHLAIEPFRRTDEARSAAFAPVPPTRRSLLDRAV